MRRLEKEGLISLKELYIDGTKIEANTNRYTFVWRGSLNYHLAGLLDTIDALYTKYNTFLLENGYGPKYNLGNARMFVIEGMDKVPVRNDPFPDSPLFLILAPITLFYRRSFKLSFILSYASQIRFPYAFNRIFQRV